MQLDAPATKRNEKITHAPGVVKPDGAADQAFLASLGRGVLDAQDLAATPIDGCQALQNVIHLSGTKGEIHLRTTQRGTTLVEPYAMLV
jgi:hypothetical protein